MGRVKAMMMEQEENFEDKALNIVDSCETWHQFSSQMEGYMDLVNHMALDDVISMLTKIWVEHQETIAKEAYSGMVKSVEWVPDGD
tara:strand:+ start:265 stop:522 length:258 start_codon:yes stop_codon:yes gene_type:complete